MKILSITHLVPYPPSGGVSLRNYNLLKEASKHNEVHLITFYQKTHVRKPGGLEEAIRAMKEICAEVQVYEIPTDQKKLKWYTMLAMNMLSSYPYSVWWYHSREMMRAIREHLKKHTFDVVEIGEIGLAEYGRLAPDTPKVLVHHNIESQLLARRAAAAGNPLSRFYLRVQAGKLRNFEHRTCPNIAWHTTCSEDDRKTLLEICPGANVQVVPNGVDTGYFKPNGEAVEKNSLVYVGGMGWFPNLDAMTYFKNEIWPLLKKKVPDIKMTVVGSKPPRELLEFSKSEPNFKLTGFVDDIRPIVNKAAVYVVPLRVGGGTRLKVLDALAMGKAIVSTRIGSEGIKLKDGTDVSFADDPQSFTDRVVELLENNAKRESYEGAARRNAESNYAWSVIGPLLQDAYEKAAGGMAQR